MGTQYKSLLGLTEVIADSAEISNIDLEATNITGLTTSRIPEGYNLYYTDARVSENPNVSSNTTHRERKDNPHGVTAAQVGIHTTNDIIEGHINLYYTDIRFDDRLATKTTTSLAEGSNLYYTDARFDTRFGIKTTTDLTEGTNLYYTDARFDTRFGIKTTTNLTEGANLYYTTTRANEDFDNRFGIKTTSDLTEGANLYYTDARFDTRFGIKTTTNLTEGTNLYYTTTRANTDFDTRFGIKTTTDLTEGTNLYYTDARFDTRLATKSTTDLTEGTNLYYTTTRANADFDTRLATKSTTNLTEGSNLYYTDTRVSANTDVKANTAYRNTGHLPLSGGTLTGNLNMGNRDIDNVNQIFIDRKGAANNKLVLWDNGVDTTTDFYGFGLQPFTLVYNVNADSDNHKFYYSGTNELFRIGHAGVFSYRNLSVTGNISLSGTVDGADLKTLNTTVNNHIENTNNPHGVLASQIADFDTEVSANADVKNNTAYTAVGHLPLSGGVMGGEITWDTDIEIPTWSSNTVYTPSDDPNWSISSSSIWGSSYQTFEAFNKTVDAGSLDCWISASGRYNSNGTVNTSTYNTTQVDGNNAYRGEWIQVRHTEKKLRLTSFILTARSNNEYSKYYRLLGTNDDPSGSPNWTTLMYNTTQLVWSGPGASLVLTPETRLGYYNTYRLLITQCTIGYCSIARFIPTFVTEGTVIDGTSINGAHVDTLIADVKTNSEYTAIGHLPLDGGTLTGDLSINGELNIGGEKITTGATNGLQLYGNSSDIGGPHIQAFVSTDDYPVFQQLNNSHGSIAMCFDVYADGFTWKSSSDSNAIIYKSNTDLEFSYSSGVAAGGEVTWNAGFSMDLANGLVSFSTGVDVTGDLTISGTVDGVDVADLNASVVKLTGDQVVAGTKSFSSRIQASGNTITPYGAGVELGYSGTKGILVSFDRSNNLYKDMRYNCLSHSFECSAVDILNISSTGVNITGNITVSGSVDGVDVAALNTDVKANTAKVSASGTINTHNDVNLNLLKDYEVLTYFSGEWKNMPTQAPDTSAFLVINGTKAMTGNLNMGNNSIDNINQIFIDRKSTAYNKLVLWDNGSDSITEFYGFGIQSSTLLYNVNISTANHKFYYGGTNEVFRIGDAGVYSYRDLDVKGNITVSGTVDGVDLEALKSAVDTNTAKVSASGSINTHSDVNITTPTDGHVLTYTSGEWKNIAPAAAEGYLPLSGGTMTGDLKLEVSRPTGGWASYFKYTGGTVNGRTYGFLLDANSFYLTAHNDDYSYSHPIMRFDHDGYCYAMKIFSAGTYRVVDVGAPVGGMDATNLNYVENAVGGRLSLNGGTMRGNIDMGGYNINTVGTVDGYNLDTLNTNINGKLSLAGGGVITNGSINIYTQGRSGSHGAVKGLYVTSDFGSISSGAEFRHSNGTQGVGIGYAGIYACGSNGSQDLTIATKGSGVLHLVQNTRVRHPNGGTIIHRGRNKHPHEGQTSWSKVGDSGEGCIGYNGNLLAWAADAQDGEPDANFAYMTKGSGGWSVGSDRRLKNNIVDMNINGCCLKLSQLKPRNYYMNGDESKTPCSGFLADEMKTVYPELVTNSGLKIGDDENIEGINYTGMVPILVGAIQSMMGKIDELKNRIEILEKPII